MESITSFFRRSYRGRLDQNLVESDKRVIVFEYPHVLKSIDTVEEATVFLLKEKEAGRARHAAVYLHETDLWHKVDASLVQSRHHFPESEEVPQESPTIKALESITTFVRRANFGLRWPSTDTGFTGRLDQSLVHSGKRVIVFEYPHLLRSADTVEEATTFLLEEKEAGRALRASIYKHDTDEWREVDMTRRQTCPPASDTSDLPKLAP